MYKNIATINRLRHKGWIGLSILLAISGCMKTIDHSTEGNSISTKYVISHAPSAATIERAKAFRAEIDTNYKILKENKIYGSDTKIQLTQLAQKYIPIGSSMNEAGDLLTVTGFKVSDFPKNNPYSRFFIGKLVMEESLLGHTAIFIILSPKSDSDFTVSSIDMQTESIGL